MSALDELLEGNAPGLGDGDDHEAAVFGPALTRDPALALELLEELGHRRLREALQLGELRDAPRTSIERVQHAGLGSRRMAAELPPDQPDKQPGAGKKLPRHAIDSLRAASRGLDRHRIHIGKLY